MNRHELLELIPAYALGALDADERAQVEALVAADFEARKMLVEYRRLADALVLLTPALPASEVLYPDMRRRLLTAVAPDLVMAGGYEPRSRAPGRVWGVLAGTAAMLILLLGGVLLAVLLDDDGASSRQRFNDILTERGSRRISLIPGDDQPAQGALVVTADGMRAAIQVWQLPELSAGQTFQLWLVDEDGARSGGLFRAESPPGPTVIELALERSLHTYQAVGVSIEPAGGSPLGDMPSGPRVFRVALDS